MTDPNGENGNNGSDPLDLSKPTPDNAPQNDQPDATGTNPDTVETNPEPEFTEDSPYVVEETGDKYWRNDGKTYREARDGSVYVADGDVIDVIRSLTTLYPDKF